VAAGGVTVGALGHVQGGGRDSCANVRSGHQGCGRVAGCLVGGGCDDMWWGQGDVASIGIFVSN
jgi:hypothetical protein